MFSSSVTLALRPQSTTAEIRALEADLNRHTTLQYRAPEMVDPYLRRPVDEKSDVWALGVLLYKLCYYTTPFEEHGPLAILNVQYRIPPYPVYSSQMNTLIGVLSFPFNMSKYAEFSCSFYASRARHPETYSI
jgi:AP2-associated kinase